MDAFKKSQGSESMALALQSSIPSSFIYQVFDITTNLVTVLVYILITILIPLLVIVILIISFSMVGRRFI